jgi:hypothetical protein
MAGKRNKWGELKISTSLIERPRDKKWWHGLDSYNVPEFRQPAILGTKLVTLHKNTFYGLDLDFTDTKVFTTFFETTFDDTINANSAPIWCGTELIAINVLLKNDQYQAIIANLQTMKAIQKAITLQRTLFKSCPF